MSDWQKILIAVNDTDTAMRAIHYVGKMMVAVKVSSVWLLHIFPDPPPDYFQKGNSLEDYKKEMQEKGNQIMDKGFNILKKYGFSDEVISFDIRMAEKQTISKAIIEAQEEHQCGTVVVGKRGLCKAEEFLFGSISNALARESKDFTVWVVG